MDAATITPRLEQPRAGGVLMQRMVRPRQGQVWAYGGSNGRRDTIKRVKRGAVGSWKYENGKLKPLGRATAMWVQWESRMLSITVTTLWKDWVRVA